MDRQFFANTCHNLMVVSLSIGVVLCGADVGDIFSVHPASFKIVILVAFILNVMKYRIMPYQSTHPKHTN